MKHRLASCVVIGTVTCGALVSGLDAPARFRHLTARDGLASNWVRSILRDSRGFLWIGTQSGLSRYDGISIRTYRHIPNEPGALPFPVAADLYEDQAGRLWIGGSWGSTGIAYYDRAADAFVALRHARAADEQSGRRVEAIAGAPDGRIWIGLDGAVDLFDPEEGTFERYPLLSRRGGRRPTVHALALDEKGRLWLGTSRGLYYVDSPMAGPCRPWRAAIPAMVGLERASVTGLLAQEGALWLATRDDGVYRMDLETGEGRRYGVREGLPTDRTRCLAPSRGGQIWIGTENGGLSLLDPSTGSVLTHAPSPDQVEGLNSGSIWALHSDSEGILWVGTYSGGVNVLSPLAQRFSLLRAGPGRLSDPHVEAVVEDHAGNIWVGTDGGGLNRIDAQTERVTYYRHERGNRHSMGSDSVAAITEDRDGIIWAGGWDSGLCRLDPRTGRVTLYRHDPDDPQSIVSNHVWGIAELRDRRMVVATQGGADLVDPGTGVFSRLSAQYPGVRQTYTFSMTESPQGDLWLGSAEVAYRIAPGSGEVTVFAHAAEDSNSLGRGIVAAIHVDSEGNTWLGTEGGLNCLPAGSSTMRRYTSRDVLPHDTVTNIEEDREGNLWVATNLGLTELVDAIHLPDPLTAIHFDEADGLQGLEFGRDASFSSQTGQLFFGGSSGLNAFFPEAITRNDHAPPVVLTGLRIFNSPVSPGAPGSPLKVAIGEADEVALPPDMRTVTFEFAALNLLLPSKNQFAYRLDGFEDRWNNVGTQRTATYTELPHGTYTLRVRASNSDDVWNETGASLKVVMLPRWHERRTVRLGAFLAVGVLLYAGHRRRVHGLTTRERELTERVAERTADLHQLNADLERRVASRTVELESEKERLSVTLRSIGDGVIAADIEGRIGLMNRVAEQLTGWTHEEALGRDLEEVFPVVDRDTREPLISLVRGAMSEHGVRELSTRFLLVRRDGREIEIADSVAPIRDSQSRIIGVVVVFRDVGERLRMEEQIQNTQKLEALGILAGGIAHDFNNLLTGVFGHIDIAQRRYPDHKKAIQSLGKALSVLEKARGLTGQLLTFSHAGEPERAPVALGALLENGTQFALSGSNVTCQVSIPPDLWPCDGDARQIDQVFDNLLLNARQAMPRGGTVRVTAANVLVQEEDSAPVAPGRYVRIEVADDGPGVPIDARARIFEPFFTTKSSGSGLGLATCYSIVRKHGGHIALEPSDPGAGARFVVLLPAAKEQATEASSATPDLAAGAGRILVLDDEEYVREVAKEMLGDLGYTAVTVPSAEEAVESVRCAVASSTPFHLAILDLTIPGGAGGVEVLPRLRALQPDLPAVASSGYSVDKVMTSPEDYGFDARLAKPYTAAELSQVVARFLG